MIKNLLEYAIGSLEVIEERKNDKGEKELDVKVKWQEADIVNGNHRRYGKGILEREIKRVQGEIDSGKKTVWGHAWHPQDGVGKAKDISHKWNKVWMENDGTCYGKITILPTEAGKNIQTLVRAGKIGMSSRGFGSFTEKEKMIDGKMTKFRDVNGDFKLECPGDFVVAPSVIGAGNLTEEINELESKLNGALIPDKDKKREVDLKKTKKGYSIEELDNHMKHLFEQDTNFRGTLEEYINQKGLPVYAKNLVEQGTFATVEEALKYLKPRKKVLAKDVLIEAHIAGVDAKTYADKINATIDQEVVATKIEFSFAEKVAILTEAKDAGIDVRNPEEKKRILEMAKAQKGGTVQKSEPLTEGQKKGLLGAEKMLAGVGSILFIEPKKNKGVKNE